MKGWNEMEFLVCGNLQIPSNIEFCVYDNGYRIYTPHIQRNNSHTKPNIHSNELQVRCNIMAVFPPNNILQFHSFSPCDLNFASVIFLVYKLCDQKI